MLKNLKIIIALASMALWLGAGAQARLGFSTEGAASVGIYVKDLATGRVVAQNDAQRSVVPASVMKSVTAAAALTALGDSFQFVTPVYLYGRQSARSDAEWNGNLVIEACADPTIDSELFDGRPSLATEIVRGLSRLGISSISGRIVISQSLQDPGYGPEWELGDVAWEYGAGLFGFNYSDNKCSVWPQSGRTRPHQPGMAVTVIDSDNGTEYLRGITSDSLVIYCRRPKDASAWRTTASMPDPAAAFEYELGEALAGAGITVRGLDIDDESERLLVCNHHSPEIFDMLRQMMVESHNLFAEGMLRALAPDQGRKQALEREKDVLATIGVSSACVKICDGSGLARADKLSAKFVSDVLEGMAKGRYASQYAALFPKAGEEGTVRSLMGKTSLKGRLALKSGSMGAVQCYAGYKLDANDRPTHTVVILVNNFYCSRGELRGSIENFLLKTFNN